MSDPFLPVFPSPTLYGWFSAEAARLYGSHVYTRPDGSNVQVTDVSQTPTPDGNEWPDLIPMGEVVDWVRRLDGIHRLPEFGTTIRRYF